LAFTQGLLFENLIFMVTYLRYRSIKKHFIIFFLNFRLIILKNLLIENLCLIRFKSFLRVTINGLSKDWKIWLGIIRQHSLIIRVFWDHWALIYRVIILDIILIRLFCFIFHLIQQFLLWNALIFHNTLHVVLLIILSLYIGFLWGERNHLNNAWLGGFQIICHAN